MLHTWLGTECSSLDFYLHQCNLVPSPNCVCGTIENNKHYLLDCHQYVNARDKMLNIIIRYSNITADILLFGNTDLPVHLLCCFTSKSTAMVMAQRSVHLTTLFPGQA